MVRILVSMHNEATTLGNEVVFDIGVRISLLVLEDLKSMYS